METLDPPHFFGMFTTYHGSHRTEAAKKFRNPVTMSERESAGRPRDRGATAGPARVPSAVRSSGSARPPSYTAGHGRRPLTTVVHAEEDRRIDPKSLSEGMDVVEGQVDLAALDAAHVVPMQPSVLRKLLL